MKHHKQNSEEVCKSKVRYFTEEDAWVNAYRFFNKYGNDQKPYICAICQEYHLTSKAGVIPKWLVQKINKGEIE